MAARTRAARLPVASARPLCRLAVGNHVAANAGRHRARLFPALHPRIAHRARFGRRIARHRVGLVGRVGLLQPRAQPACRRAANHGRIRWAVSANARRMAAAQRCGAQHGRRCNRLCLSRARNHIGRQCETRTVPHFRPRRRPEISRVRTQFVGAGRTVAA